MSKTSSEIAKTLSEGPRIDLSKDFLRASGVALLLFGTGADMELLFIKRALNPKDQWSGQIAFPGGKRSDDDASLLSACLREVHEEIGFAPTPEMLLGSLDDIQARKQGQLLDFYIEPFVFHLPHRPSLLLSKAEVDKVFWISLDYLTNPTNFKTYELRRDGQTLALPAVSLPEGETLWGLSYLMVRNFFEKMETK